jgi:frataxin-like iron-binding protein CyaY
MSFLNQSILWGLLAASIPIIIHLLNRRRHRTVKWAAMAFILKATRESKGKKKLKHIIILTARTLALAAIIFAVAQPIIGGILGWGGSKLDTVVLVLDRSLSMETETGNDGLSKREQAISQVKQTLKEMGNPNLILIDSASGSISEVNPIDTLDQLSITAATDTNSSIPELIEKASNYIQNNQTGQTEIWVASDLQSSDWQANSSRWETIRSGLNRQCFCPNQNDQAP